LYGQLITPSGSLVWEADGALLVEADNQQNELTLNSSGHEAQWFWLTWKSSEDGQTEDIYSQRFDLNGDALIVPAAGIAIGMDNSAQQTPETIMDDVDGLYIIWEETEVDELFSDLKFTRINTSGEIMETPVEGDFLTTAYHRQAEISAVGDELGGFVAVWRDNRATGKDELQNIYMQRVNWDTLWVLGGDLTQIPTKTRLDNNYPNPFNPSTTIKFSIDSPSNVALVVYDVLGREVTRLVSQKLFAGEHAAHWDGLTSFGQPVASGVYFYRLEVGGEVMTRSMVLLK